MSKTATKTEVSKSDEIRKLLAAHPNLSAKDVVSTLASRGLTVTPNLVYFVKGAKATKNGHSNGRHEKDKVKSWHVYMSTDGTTNGSTNGDVLTTITKVKDLAKHVGGMNRLKDLVTVMAE